MVQGHKGLAQAEADGDRLTEEELVSIVGLNAIEEILRITATCAA